MLFENFQLRTIDTGEVNIRLRYGGEGPPLLLLHGHPQTHMMWHHIAPLLATTFTVVMPDLRGYGDSSKPQTTNDHYPYSKRAMARDQIAMMKELGFNQFSVVGHDRGGRCAYRLALDFPEAITKLAVLDIIPTGEALRRTNKEFSLGFWHWFFLAQPFDLPEQLIGHDPDSFYFRGDRSIFHPEALDDYLRCIHQPGTIHAMCEDYRAGASIDYELDEADRGIHTIKCPILVLWSEQGELPKWYDVLSIWRDWAEEVEGRGINCGHYLAEEAPKETFEELYNFLID
ncbi:alpha/beta fold hydrolase [Paenibacillus sp. LMG 31459]|uniref:Alpha/beta fold hydrolase n=1 Tax=Paenibacillus phytohabitans TaxID=2654978 RepID=A0ABX1YER2_9BACL|nr:alpha/beta hydrolase [Paenibacillus phytohabitans]NOU79483.1 alpha/beta fold hydrolase [Paenibacillus phytohabitans]